MTTLAKQVGLGCEEFAQLFWSTAVDYVETAGKGDDALKTNAFWKWWRHQWRIYDARFKRSPTIEKARKRYDERTLYKARHAAKNKTDIYTSYCFLVNPLRHAKKNASTKRSASCSA